MESKSVRVHTPLFMRDVNASVQKGLGKGPNSNLGTDSLSSPLNCFRIATADIACKSTDQIVWKKVCFLFRCLAVRYHLPSCSSTQFNSRSLRPRACFTIENQPQRRLFERCIVSYLDGFPNGDLRSVYGWSGSFSMIRRVKVDK